MLEFPSRLTSLIARLEAGEELQPEELRRIARLQALDMAKLGEDFVRQMCVESDRRTEEFRQLLES